MSPTPRASTAPRAWKTSLPRRRCSRRRRPLCQKPRRSLRRSIDTGDLLMLLILLLLAVDGEEEDSLSVLLTAAAFLLS